MCSRDRNILPIKCIESIHQNSSVFESINIYLFDNISSNIPERFNIFSRLLERGLIKYYSYDTVETTSYCFPKTIIFRRFIDMMVVQSEINKRTGVKLNITPYFALVDDDMLFNSHWDEYFVSALEDIKRIAPHTKYIVKYPGGIPKATRDKAKIYKIRNLFNPKETFNLMSANFGGGSGFWVMNLEMLRQLRWSSQDICQTFKKSKKHDSISWSKIKKEYGNINYVAAVIPPKEAENPLVLHLGSNIGSICNSLTMKKYNTQKNEFKEKEKRFEGKSVSEIFNHHKGFTSNW